MSESIVFLLVGLSRVSTLEIYKTDTLYEGSSFLHSLTSVPLKSHFGSCTQEWWPLIRFTFCAGFIL